MPLLGAPALEWDSDGTQGDLENKACLKMFWAHKAMIFKNLKIYQTIMVIGAYVISAAAIGEIDKVQ